MDITKKIDSLIGESNKWFFDSQAIYRKYDKKTQVEVIWKAGEKFAKVQFRDIDSREYIGHVMVPTEGMKSKEFLKHVDNGMKDIWKRKKK